MKSIGFIVLNYLAYEATQKCVASIRHQLTEYYQIFTLIIDNASPNDSYSVLCDLYKNNDDIEVICTGKNEGFARGNNIGYVYMKKKYNPDFYVFCNDDIVLENRNICEWIDKCFEKYKFSVLGPSIFSKNGNYYQNPCKNPPVDCSQCRKDIFIRQKRLAKLRIKFLLGIGEKEEIVRWENPFYKEFSDSLMLHGAFLVFSRIYFDYYFEPFDPRTFLYGEESMLKLRCMNRALRMVYSPEYEVLHEQNMSTILSDQKNIVKKINRLEREIKSMKLYLSELR